MRPAGHLVLVACWLAVGVASGETVIADRIVLKGSEPRVGRFLSFSADHFEFQVTGAAPEKYPRIRVVEMSLDPPARVEVKPRGKPALSDARFRAYANGRFQFEHGGRPVEFAGMAIASVELGLDFERARASIATTEAPAPGQTTNAAPPDIRSLLEPGRVTIVHFHLRGDVAGEREGSYARRLAEDNRGRIAYAEVPIEGWDSPAVKQYGLGSLPQFWVYNRRGALSSRVVDRITGAELDAAVAAARR